MIRKVVALFFALLILLQTFDRLGPVIYYHLNTDYIVEFFCINKEKPDLKCNGKCYLNSMLDKQEEKQEKLPIRVSEKKDIQFVVEKHNIKLNEKPNSNVASAFFYICYSSQDYNEDIFHPPIS